MRRFLTAIILFCVANFATPAVAEEQFQGKWKQIFSNAGACANCRITIRQSGASLEIFANNDWTAIAEVRDRRTAIGAGLWKHGTRKTYAGRTFDIRLWHTGYDELVMTMKVEAAPGKLQTIKALFKRIEQLRI